MKHLNPAELEVDLFCKGIRIDQSCTIDQDGRLFSRTRAGLGSGLELVIPGDLKDIWLNVPVEEDFARTSHYLLVKNRFCYIVRDETKGIDYPVVIPQEPAWYQKKTSFGTPMYRIGVLQGTYSYVLQNGAGQIATTHSVSAGLDYPSIGPEHAWLKDSGRAEYVPASDQEALEATTLLARTEGIIPALESAHAVAEAIKRAPRMKKSEVMIVNISGRGDKDIGILRENLKID